MERMRYPIKVNLEDTGTLLTNIRVKQGDSAITFVIRAYKNGENIFSVDDIPSIVFNRPDGSSVVGECSVAEGQYTYEILGNELMYAGEIKADLKFNMYTETESTVTFVFECVKNTLPDNVYGAGIYVNSLKNIKEYLDTTVKKLEQELEAFDLQQVLDAVNIVTEAKEEVERVLPQIAGVTDDVAALKLAVGEDDISEVGTSITNAVVGLDDRLDTAETQITDTSTEVTNVKTEIGDIDERVTVLENKPSTSEPMPYSEYEALSEEEKMNGTVYYTYDGTEEDPEPVPSSNEIEHTTSSGEKTSVGTELRKVYSDLSEFKNEFSWKLVGSGKNQTFVLPQNTKEVYFCVRWATNPTQVVTAQFNFELLHSVQNSHYLSYGAGGGWSANNGGFKVVLYLNGFNLSLNSVNVENRGEVASTSELTVWYR